VKRAHGESTRCCAIHRSLTAPSWSTRAGRLARVTTNSAIMPATNVTAAAIQSIWYSSSNGCSLECSRCRFGTRDDCGGGRLRKAKGVAHTSTHSVGCGTNRSGRCCRQASVVRFIGGRCPNTGRLGQRFRSGSAGTDDILTILNDRAERAVRLHDFITHTNASHSVTAVLRVRGHQR
jgi:hypothetical protein